MTNPTVVQGIVAAVLAIVLDWQDLFPKIGDRVAALLALVVGAALVANTNLEAWLHGAAVNIATLAGQLVSVADPRIGAAVATVAVGITATGLFLMWVLAFIPATPIAKKVVGTGAGNSLNSVLIWAGGLLLPAFVVLVPGTGVLHSISTWTINLGVGAGTWLVSWA